MCKLGRSHRKGELRIGFPSIGGTPDSQPWAAQLVRGQLEGAMEGQHNQTCTLGQWTWMEGLFHGFRRVLTLSSCGTSMCTPG